MSNLFIYVTIILAASSCIIEGRSPSYSNIRKHHISEGDALSGKIIWTSHKDSAQAVSKCGKCQGGKCVKDRNKGEYCQCPPGKAWYFEMGVFFDTSECRDCNCGKNQITCAFVAANKQSKVEKRCTCEASFGDKSGTCTSCDCGNGFNCIFKKKGIFTKTDEKSCICGKGYTEVNKKCVAVDPCASSPCMNAGTCIKSSGNGYTCNCVETHRGKHCETVVSPCDQEPCANGSVCVTKDQYYYECICPDGYKGKNCTELNNPCLLRPCQNGGKCYFSGELWDYICICPSTHTGKNCTEEKAPCSKNPCMNGGTCYSGRGDDYVCVCPSTHTGKNCTDDAYRDCDSEPCSNGGTCTALSGDNYTCSCQEWYTGPKCDKIKWCEEGPGKIICSFCKGGECGFDFEQKMGYCRCPQNPKLPLVLSGVTQKTRIFRSY